jgi:amino acid transporter/mannitol/fructose-specific phosphotransferase system IIA component (Ntr-type)
MGGENGAALKKELSLFDVYAVSTGAMFSSGFFLLPGLAAAQTGPAAALAYLVAGVLILPAMFSKAELCTAMPRAGGSYFFLDRSLGPLVGTIGGLGTYFALVLKTGFALLGIGVYLAVYMDLPIRPLALVLVVVFAGLNVVGAKEATWLQRFLVVVLLAVLLAFIVAGFGVVAAKPERVVGSLTPLLPHGIEGFVATIALVFVSYAGLTKVASVAEEVKNPERDIPLGMILSLLTTSVVYVFGVALVIATVPAEKLHTDLAPLATAAATLFSGDVGAFAVAAIVIAAIAAFASTGNAGLLASSRYPLAMARDRLLPDSLATVSRGGTPIPAILVTSGLMAVAILLLSEGNIAKLASAFQLVVFALICMAVIVMRESGILSYDPGFKSPFYPWMQVAGIAVSVVLLAAMNVLVLTLLGLAIAGGVAWYLLYARRRVEREGALLHWFARLGARRFPGLNVELRQIVKEKGLRGSDDVESLLQVAIVLDLAESEAESFEQVAQAAADRFAERLGCSADALATQFTGGTALGITPVGGGVGLPHARVDGLERPCLAAVRVRSGVQLSSSLDEGEEVRSLFFLVSPVADPRQHLRVLAHIAVTVENPSFMAGWMEARNAQALHEFLLRGLNHQVLRLDDGASHAEIIGRAMCELALPDSVTISFIRRRGRLLLPDQKLRFAPGDVLILNGDPGVIEDWMQSPDHIAVR